MKNRLGPRFAFPEEFEAQRSSAPVTRLGLATGAAAGLVEGLRGLSERGIVRLLVSKSRRVIGDRSVPAAQAQSAAVRPSTGSEVLTHPAGCW
jgi:hypothetical protein